MIDGAPEKLYRISQTQLSIARYYGGCIFQGKEYVYNPEDDTLTRIDVFKKERKKRDGRMCQQKAIGPSQPGGRGNDQYPNGVKRD